jgi:hypothetical protein
MKRERVARAGRCMMKDEDRRLWICVDIWIIDERVDECRERSCC